MIATVIVFGEEARKALSLPPLLIHPYERDGVVYRQFPLDAHPTYQLLAGLLLSEMYEAKS